MIGAGETPVESALNYLVQLYPGVYNTYIGYDEKLDMKPMLQQIFIDAK